MSSLRSKPSSPVRSSPASSSSWFHGRLTLPFSTPQRHLQDRLAEATRSRPDLGTAPGRRRKDRDRTVCKRRRPSTLRKVLLSRSPPRKKARHVVGLPSRAGRQRATRRELVFRGGNGGGGGDDGSNRFLFGRFPFFFCDTGVRCAIALSRTSARGVHREGGSPPRRFLLLFSRALPDDGVFPMPCNPVPFTIQRWSL